MATLLTGSPGVVLQEAILGATGNVATAYGSMCFGALRGPIGPTLTTSPSAWVSMYGDTNLNWSYAGICAKAYLAQGPGLWNQRVINTDCKYGASFILFDNSTGAAPAIQNVYLNNVGMFPTGAAAGQSSAFTLHSPITTTFPVTSVTVQLTLSGKVNKVLPITVSLPVATTSAAWMAPLAALIQSTLAADTNVVAAYGAIVPCVYTVTNAGNIFIVFAEGLTATATSSVPASVAVVNDPFIEIFARDPGATFANNYYGASVSNFSVGTKQITQMLFNRALIAGDIITLGLTVGTKTVNISSTFAVSSDATLTAFAGLINAMIASTLGMALTATATNYGGATSGFNVITISATVAGTNTFTANAVDHTGAYTISALNNGLPSTNAFTLSVYSINNVNTPLENFTISFNTQNDANGNQQFMEDAVNTALTNSAASSYIRVFSGNVSISYNPVVNGLLAPLAQPNIAWLGGGADGSLPTNGQIASTWTNFIDTETYSINVLINAGYTDPSVQQAMVGVADTRQDSVAILDVPLGFQTAAAAAAYRTASVNIISSRAALYTPNLQVLDSASNRQVWAPPSGHVAAQFAYTRSSAGNYADPAGSINGVINGATNVYVNYSVKGDRDLMDAAQINWIRKIGGAIVIDNDRTLINNNGPLSSLNVRIMINDIETYAIAQAKQFEFSLDNPTSQTALQKNMDAYLDTYVNAGALAAKAVIVDDTNNGPVYLDNAQMNMSIYLIGVRGIRHILIGVGIGTNTIGLAELEISGIV